MQARLGHGSRHGDHGEEGHADRPAGRAPADWREGRRVGRQLRADELRRRRRDGRARARRARLRLRQQVQPADQAGDRREGPAVLDRSLAGMVRRQGKRHLHPQRQVRWPRLPGRGRSHCRRPGRQGPGREEGDLAPARLGHLAPALLGHADPADPLRQLRRGAGPREGPAGGAARRPGAGRHRQPAGQGSALPAVHLPVVRQAGAP
ncbi:hypothetical protein D3C81_1057160 [compost metagenome]